VNETSQNKPIQSDLPAILHVCKREMVRPLRDQILRVSGFQVDSTLNYALVLIDVEGENGVHEAEQLCSDVKEARHDQVVAFVCNWRVAILSDCPDEIVRTEFNPATFVAGVKKILSKD